jgi:hypothetical protein
MGGSSLSTAQHGDLNSAWRTPDQERRALLRRQEMSLSQGTEWKALISMYIKVIPFSGDTSCAPMHDIACAPLPRGPVSNAMTAKVGAAARHTQLLAPRTAAASHCSRVPLVCFIIVVHPGQVSLFVRVDFRSDVRVGGHGMDLVTGRPAVGVTSVTGFQWIL